MYFTTMSTTGEITAMENPSMENTKCPLTAVEIPCMKDNEIPINK